MRALQRAKPTAPSREVHRLASEVTGGFRGVETVSSDHKFVAKISVCAGLKRRASEKDALWLGLGQRNGRRLLL